MDDIATVRRVAKRVNLYKLATQSGVPYTTLRDWAAKDFDLPQLVQFTRLVEAARRHEQDEQAA